MQAMDSDVRVVLVRTGIVLSGGGGALKKMLPAFKAGVAGRLGNGKQWCPWIHIDDEIGLLHWSIDNGAISGPINSVSPGIVTNAEFTSSLAGALHRPAILPVPEFGLKLLLGEMAEALLASQRVVPQASLNAGYEFKFTAIDSALKNLLG
jgi:uncharacterized protein (TIGR01777 family)